MDKEEGHMEPQPTRELAHLKAAFLAMEPADCVVSIARQCGGGSLTVGVQRFIMDGCVKSIIGLRSALSHAYIKNILKKVIFAAESSRNEVLEDLYEFYAHYISSFKEDVLAKDATKIQKSISFLFSKGHSRSMNLVVPLHCSSNMLEGDTGCSIWPSSLFLSEFILSYPDIFFNKFCLEVGAGVGLVGIILSKVRASKVILTDGDLSTLANMKANLEFNHLGTGNGGSQVECKSLSWETTSERELTCYSPDIVLGADVIYDPSCLPHLVRVLAFLLKPKKHVSHSCEGRPSDGDTFASDHQVEACRFNLSQNNLERHDIREPVAYIATVIRNVETFNCFAGLACEAILSIVDVTEEKRPLSLLPYLISYDRASVKLYMISHSEVL